MTIIFLGRIRRHVKEAFMDWGIVGFDIAMVIVAGLLIPIGIKIISLLNSIKVSISSTSKVLGNLCNSVEKITDQIRDAHLRDKDIEHRLDNIEKYLDK